MENKKEEYISAVLFNQNKPFIIMLSKNYIKYYISTWILRLKFQS